MENIIQKQSDLLQNFTDAKDRLVAAIQGLDDNLLITEQIVGHWTIKDILGHLVSWNREFRDNIAVILSDGHPGYDHQISGSDNFSVWNQAWVDEKKSWPLDKIIADIDRDAHEAADLISALNMQQLGKRGLTPWKDAALKKSTQLADEDMDAVEDLLTYQWHHMHHHTAEIEAWNVG